ncbi:hypothetical protein [Vibrio antiquarius]|uniref:hypothetical protein n=1 Tax=Vibrio antiquarius (strain Ex25) TaxID=150340 RepID=UPI002659EE7C|nr:hypothetical protein [Vibrio antiquarius]MCR9549573.1 hypothetical protein [Vibrio antiquarius]
MKQNVNTALTNKQINDICRIIAMWESKLTWHRLVEVIKRECGFYISRQSLSSYISIKKEYDLKKKDLRGIITIRSDLVGKEQATLIHKIEQLEAQVKQLTKERDLQLETLERIFLNASEMPNVGRQGLRRLLEPR